MKYFKNIQFMAFLTITAILASCAPKEVPEPAEPVEVTVSETEEETTTVLEQITTKDSHDDSKKKEPEEDATARTYPNPDTIKEYEPLKVEDSWFLVGGVTGQRAYSIFVDPETIVSKDGLTRSWSKLQFEETQRDEDGLSYQEVQIASDVDCENRTYSYTDSKFYDALGRLVESQRTPYEPLPIVEGTVSSKIADFVCGYDLNRPK